jgi:3-methyladenine DNA glycosylase/8-oxoguanine DNA glycosylase
VRCLEPGEGSVAALATGRMLRIALEGAPFSLAATCAPVAWGKGRWPNVDWIDGAFLWVGWESEAIVWRETTEFKSGVLRVDGPGDPGADASWAERVLGLNRPCPVFEDEVVERLRRRYAGLRAFSYGSLFDGLVTSIVGQSISLAAAAVTEARLAALFHPGFSVAGRHFRPLPRAEQLATAQPALVRQSGVTWRRAEALVAVGKAAAEQRLPERLGTAGELDAARQTLRGLPLVGPWTAESALLWGVGADDAYPTGDVALLRAARHAYRRPELDRAGLDRLAEGWRPSRSWAARLLWTDLLGPAPGTVGAAADDLALG